MEAVSQTGAGTGSSSTDSHGIGSRCLTRAGIRLPPCPASTGLISGRPDLSDRTPSCGERQAGASGLYHWPRKAPGRLDAPGRDAYPGPPSRRPCVQRCSSAGSRGSDEGLPGHDGGLRTPRAHLLPRHSSGLLSVTALGAVGRVAADRGRSSAACGHPGGRSRAGRAGRSRAPARRI